MDINYDLESPYARNRNLMMVGNRELREARAREDSERQAMIKEVTSKHRIDRI